MNHRLATIAALCLALAGCSRQLDTEYGQRSGPAAASVNGTSVLADMFKTAGHSVSGATWAGPKLAQNADVIVWFPDSMLTPSSKERRWFETWLGQQPDRTLIYVGRDFDAATGYWNYVIEHSTGEEQAAARQELRHEQVGFGLLRLTMPERSDCGWFVAFRKLERRDVRDLSGNQNWTADVDAKKLGIELNGRLLPGRRATTLLGSQHDMLVSRKRIGASKILVVANGSFLLNLPLVNHEHRKLAGKLIDSVGTDRRVVFLESGSSGLEIFDKDPEPISQSGLAILVTEPFDIPILHLAVAGVVFCLARFPIFGRPRQWQPDELSDFGAHVAALGRLLAMTKDRAFALATLASYQRAAHAGPTRARTPVSPLEELSGTEPAATESARSNPASIDGPTQ